MILSALIVLLSSIPGLTGRTASSSLDPTQAITHMASLEVSSRFDPEYYRFEVKERWIPGKISKLNASQIHEVRLVGTIEEYTNFEVEYRFRGRAESVRIQLKIEAEQKLPVPVKRLIQGERVTADNIDMRWYPVRLGRDQWISDPDQLIGKTLRRTKNAGEPISESEITTPYLVEAGDEVAFQFDEYGISIVVTCETRQPGSIGEEITIYCKETRRKYTGQVTGPGQVIWIKTL